MVSAAIAAAVSRLHLDAGAIDGVDVGLHLDVRVLETEVHQHRSDQERVAQREQVRGLLGRLDPRDPGDGEDVALA